MYDIANSIVTQLSQAKMRRDRLVLQNLSDGRGRLTHAALSALLCGALLLCLAPLPAAAHPHAWVVAKLDVIYKDGAVTALRHTWLFDEFYTQGATEGLDTNKDGRLEPSELAELTKVNIDGLKEFGYFSSALSNGEAVKFGTPRDASMAMLTVPVDEAPKAGAGAGSPGMNDAASGDTVASGQPGAQDSQSPTKRTIELLSLTFTLPLAQPVPAEANGMEISVKDPSIFIWFEFANKTPVTLVNAPKGCNYKLESSKLSAEQQRLQDAFGGASGFQALTGSALKSVQLTCLPG